MSRAVKTSTKLEGVMEFIWPWPQSLFRVSLELLSLKMELPMRLMTGKIDIEAMQASFIARKEQIAMSSCMQKICI